MNSYIKRAMLFLQDIIFTVKCPYCEKVIDRNDYACKECKSKFPQKGYETYAVGGYKTIAPFKYDGIFASGVKNFKFYENPSYSRRLAIPLANEIIAKYGVGWFFFFFALPIYFLISPPPYRCIIKICVNGDIINRNFLQKNVRKFLTFRMQNLLKSIRKIKLNIRLKEKNEKAMFKVCTV